MGRWENRDIKIEQVESKIKILFFTIVSLGALVFATLHFFDIIIHPTLDAYAEILLFGLFIGTGIMAIWEYSAYRKELV